MIYETFIMDTRTKLNRMYMEGFWTGMLVMFVFSMIMTAIWVVNAQDMKNFIEEQRRVQIMAEKMVESE